MNHITRAGIQHMPIHYASCLHAALTITGTARPAIGWPIVIHTKRCTIRPLVETDIDAVMAYRNDTTWMRYQGLKGLDRQAYIDKLIGSGFCPTSGGQLAIIEDATSRIIGDLFISITPPSCRIGFTISRAQARQGFGFEAVAGLIEAVTALPGITLVKADADPDNVASIKLLNKLGFTLVGTKDDSVFYELTLAKPAKH